MKDGRTRVSMGELTALATTINQLLDMPPEPWAEVDAIRAGSTVKTTQYRSNKGCYFVEPINDAVQLSQMTDTDGTVAVVLGPANRGALLRLMNALIVGIQLGRAGVNSPIG